MHEVEVIKFRKSDNSIVGKKIMTYDDWMQFPRITNDFRYIAYQIGFSQFSENEKIIG